MSEFEPEHNDDGGYVEPNRFKPLLNRVIAINTKETAQ
jgi:hypothetical protein